jgi:acyl-CoA-binding protein
MFDLKVTNTLHSLPESSARRTEHTADTNLLRQGKAKRNAWQKLVDEGISPSDAQKKYVALVESLKTKHGYTG